MMKNLTCMIIFSCLLNYIAYAQEKQGVIRGFVMDSVTKKPIEYMTVALKKENTVLKSVIVEATGAFNFKEISSGKYIITAIAVGYTPKNFPVEITSSAKDINLGQIFIVGQSNDLKEVSVTADRPIIKQEADRITYDIQADPEAKIMTALDMMRKVPLLSLDAEDNIQLKGSGNFKILINGKPSGMIARSPKDVLRSMPASSIQKIEVITTPPAKYDSEGLAGIINIITTKKIDNGYNGSLNLRHQGPVGGPSIGTYFTVKQNKLGITGYGGTGFYSSPNVFSETNRTTTGEDPTQLSNIGSRKFDNNFRYGGAEISYEIDTLNLITAELNPYSGYNNSSNDQRISLTGNQQNSSYDIIGRNKYRWSGFDATLNYQLGFKSDKNRLLTFSYKYTDNSNPQDNALTFMNRQNFVEPDYKQHNESKSREQTIQLDYVHPVKKVNVEGGIKGILRDNNSNYEYLVQDPATGGFNVDPERTNKFDNNQDVIGFYNSYALNLDKWSFKAGVRAEGTFVKANFTSSGTNVNSDYFNVIPTFSVSHKFKDMSNVNFGFTQRIERPGIDNLNPFVDRSIPNFESTGNPDLEAVVSNNFELTYSRFKKGNINIGLNYNYANNTIQSISIYNAADQITRSTYENIGKNKALTSNININFPITPKWNVSMNGNFGYTWLEGTIDGKITQNEGVTGYGYVNTGYKFANTWKANASFSYSAPWVQLQGSSSSNHYMSFSGSKEIIKDKLTLSAGINNPFTKYRYFTRTTEGANFVQTMKYQNYNRNFNASLNWKFGKLKDAIKKSQRSINNDDVKSSSKSGT